MTAESRNIEGDEATTAKEQVSVAANQHATIYELLEAMFSMRSLSRLYSEAQRRK